VVPLEVGGANGKTGSVLPGRRDEAGFGLGSRSGGRLRRHTFLTFFLGHGAPHSVGFMHLEGVLATVLQDRTGQAHSLGCVVAVAARWASLTGGMEEDVWILAPAGAIELPFPQICNWPW